MVAGFVFFDAFVNIEYIESYLLTYVLTYLGFDFLLKSLLAFTCKWSFNANKAGLFEGSFSWGWGRGGGQLDLPSYFKKTLSNVNITLYNC